MNHGLGKLSAERIRTVLARYPEVERAILYGSRAKGDFKPGSDIDLTLVGSSLNQAILGRIAQDLDDLLLPWRFDLTVFDKVTHKELIEHIRRVGVVLYEKSGVKPS